jgi:hypothetical protein
MKTHAHPSEDLEQTRYEADLGASINALFVRCPRLHGFALRGAAPLSGHGFPLQRASGLVVTDLSIYPACDLDTALKHLDKIEAALTRLIDECPEARELLCGRTFARVLH